ncbi:hypothetical protein [Massilia sp. METH4]|uniref:hypothetical protein n=1 Tax=Massilia sp. METH4 TaxID=3123041 RepID=UPI0030D2F186
MQKSKQYFFIATTALMLATPFANTVAAPAVAATAAISQPALVAAASGAAETSPAADQSAVKSASSHDKGERTGSRAAQLSDWSMLLVGAGLLLLPRRRRPADTFTDQRSAS